MTKDEAIARANAEHARAEGLAKEVAGLRARAETAEGWRLQAGEQHERAKAAEAKLAVYEAPVGDGERDAILARLDERHRGDGTAATRFTLEGDSAALIRRLSAINAQREEENTKLREALTKIAKHPEQHEEVRKGRVVSSYGVGWAFWNVQGIARAVLSAGEAGTT